MKKSILYGAVDFMDMELKYYIISEDISEEFCDLESYGVKITKTQCSEGGGKIKESKEINNVFYRRADVEKFMKLLMDNYVTPVALMEVVEDYIVDYFMVR